MSADIPQPVPAADAPKQEVLPLEKLGQASHIEVVAGLPPFQRYELRTDEPLVIAEKPGQNEQILSQQSLLAVISDTASGERFGVVMAEDKVEGNVAFALTRFAKTHRDGSLGRAEFAAFVDAEPVGAPPEVGAASHDFRVQVVDGKLVIENGQTKGRYEVAHRKGAEPEPTIEDSVVRGVHRSIKAIKDKLKGDVVRPEDPTALNTIELWSAKSDVMNGLMKYHKEQQDKERFGPPQNAAATQEAWARDGTTLTAEQTRDLRAQLTQPTASYVEAVPAASNLATTAPVEQRVITTYDVPEAMQPSTGETADSVEEFLSVGEDISEPLNPADFAEGGAVGANRMRNFAFTLREKLSGMLGRAEGLSADDYRFVVSCANTILPWAIRATEGRESELLGVKTSSSRPAALRFHDVVNLIKETESGEKRSFFEKLKDTELEPSVVIENVNRAARVASVFNPKFGEYTQDNAKMFAGIAVNSAEILAVVAKLYGSVTAEKVGLREMAEVVSGIKRLHSVQKDIRSRAA